MLINQGATSSGPGSDFCCTGATPQRFVLQEPPNCKSSVMRMINKHLLAGPRTHGPRH